jgi:hypothetical protein
MNSKLKIPDWISNGPEDIEYRTYKLRGTISVIKDKLETGNLMEALFDIDDALDYLYKYDAVKMTSNPDTINQIVSGFDFPNLELVFTTGDDMETDDILDLLLNEAIDEYENLHSICREQWRVIEDGLKCDYIPKKPYFLNDGFVFVKTPDNKMHVYHFTKPNKYFTHDWKRFNMTHLHTVEYTSETYFANIDEILTKNSDKIIIKIECSTDTVLENNAMCVINQKVFSMLSKDYSF